MFEITGGILAGGRSSRMGSNKALLEIEGITVIERITKQLSPVVSEMMISANEKQDYLFLGKVIVQDSYPGKGPLAGVHSLLAAANTPWCIVCACDMPFVTTDIFRVLVDAASLVSGGLQTDRVQAILPITGGRIQPLLAAYHRSAFPSLEQMLQADKLRMTDWLDHLRVRYLTEEELTQQSRVDANQALFNMNNPEEYKHAKQDSGAS
ncbi:molybdenum cofactor guanylyltransferase [Paenibacillus pini]